MFKKHYSTKRYPAPFFTKLKPAHTFLISLTTTIVAGLLVLGAY